MQLRAVSSGFEDHDGMKQLSESRSSASAQWTAASGQLCCKPLRRCQQARARSMGHSEVAQPS
eukprot:15475369-Alexandrium_andersonii.AAC.1